MGGEDEFSAWRIIHGREVFRRYFSGEILHCVSLPEFLYNFFFVFCFLFTYSILHVEMIGIIVQGKVSPELNCQKDISIGRRIFP